MGLVSTAQSHSQKATLLRNLLREWGRRSARLGRQIVNLEVAGSNPVGPAIHVFVAVLTCTVSFRFITLHHVSG